MHYARPLVYIKIYMSIMKYAEKDLLNGRPEFDVKMEPFASSFTEMQTKN